MFVFNLGAHTQQCSGYMPKDPSWWGLGDHMETRNQTLVSALPAERSLSSHSMDVLGKNLARAELWGPEPGTSSI